MIEIILNTKKEYNLESNPYCNRIKKDLDSFIKKTQSNFEINHTFADTPIPDPNKIPPEKAFEYSSQISCFLHKMEEPINYTIDALVSKKKHNSCIYRAAFGFGSVLLILSKIIEWLYGIKKG